MRNQATSLTLSTEKSGVALCALSTGGMGWYLGSKETVITSHQASAFTARNPRNPEADPKAALD